MSKMTKSLKFLLISAIFLSLFQISSNYSIKDIFTYKKGDAIEVTVGSMNSVETQLPFDYYYLDICTPDNMLPANPDNIGDILTGDISHKTIYQFNIEEERTCQVACKKTFIKRDVELMNWMINRNYTTMWYVDKLPAGRTHFTDLESGKVETHYLGGIPLGYKEDNPADNLTAKIYNHYTFIIHLHKESEGRFTVVGFDILPASIYQTEKTGLRCSDDKNDLRQNFRKDKQGISEETVLFSYDVVFVSSKIKFSSRWDHYLHLKEDSIHWYSLINSSLIILIFSFIVLQIFCRALKRDIDIYNTRVTGEDFIDEFGWKQVCNDVFRKPRYSMLLSSLIGTGIQLCSMVIYTLIFAILGFLTPEKRGALLMIMILLFVFMGVFAGYYSARFYKMFGGREWLKNALLTAFLYPSVLFTIFLTLNVFFWLEGSSARIKFLDFVVLLVLWICCSSPLVLIGAFMGVKKKTIKNPCKVNPVPSSIPEKSWYLKLKYITLFSGVIPFGAIFIELVYIMASIWRHYFYYLFGFLFVVLVLLIITCSEISIILTYVYLCKGDYNWWWKSFIISGSPAIYVFAYSIYYFFSLSITRLSSIFLYFGLMSILTSIVFLITGTMGLIFTYLFLRKIYSMIKID